MKTNYILIDFENVQPATLFRPPDFPIRIIVFVGEKQQKIPLDLASALQVLGTNAEYIRISGQGQNALDFHLAFWIGRLAERDSQSYFHIVSRDKGFDPLIAHLKTQRRGCWKAPGTPSPSSACQ
ncbi:MAG: PIN domain-containing protein [Verrucomicrobiales bacterium]